MINVHADSENSGYVIDRVGNITPSIVSYWFAWSAFYPETQIYEYVE